MRANQTGRQDTCHRKQRHASRARAKIFAKLASKSSGRPIRAYWCEPCHSYHIGGIDKLPPRRIA